MMSMKRNVFVVVLILFAVAVQGALFAQAADEHGRSIDEMLSEIRQEQGVAETARIDPDRVSERLLEQLGESVMSYMVPDPKQHEWMDDMMGGEGSENLDAMHRIMGYRYLEEGDGFLGSMMGGMFGGRRSGGWASMMGFGVGGSMMGHGSAGYRWWWLLWILVILLVAAVIVLAILLVGRQTRGNVSLGAADALQILKQRYARGEIDGVEYQRLREELR